MTKDELRIRMRQNRRTLSKDFIHSASKKITDSLILLPCMQSIDAIMLYLSAFKEPNTDFLFSHFNNIGVKTVVPISNTDDNTITPSLIKSIDNTICGAYGIREPSEFIPFPISEIDVAVIPGVAFGSHGERLGFGKGYYDRFLAEFKGTKIGICYDFQITDEIPVLPHDIKMDIIVTEKRIYNDF